MQKVTAEEFYEAVTIERKNSLRARFFLTEYSKEYREMRCFLSPDGGGAIKTDGEIVSVFRTASSPPGSGAEIIKSLLKEGGSWLTCMGNPLRDYYKKFGFVVTGGSTWNYELAPRHWNIWAMGTPNIYDMHYYDPSKFSITGNGFWRFCFLLSHAESNLAFCQCNYCREIIFAGPFQRNHRLVWGELIEEHFDIPANHLWTAPDPDLDSYALCPICNFQLERGIHFTPLYCHFIDYHYEGDFRLLLLRKLHE